MRAFAFVLTLSLFGLAPAFAIAQESSTPPAHIAFVEGAATIERDGEIETAAINMPVVEGDRLRTTTGRLQLAMPDGSAIDVEPYSEIDYLGGGRVRVNAGTIENRPEIAERSASAQYLPTDVQSYAGDLDRDGTWQYDTTYGNVWYPTVAADWRPYYYGYWSSVPSYGWTWIGYNRWAWPTHHYGRWGYARNRWFWMPGRTYASAWVSWGTAPGYVSWCPLGYDSRPIVGLSVGYQHGWNPWTIVPRSHFGWRGYPAHRYAIEPYRVAASTPFVVQRGAPPATARGIGSYGSAQRTYAAPGRAQDRSGSSQGARSFDRSAPSSQSPARSYDRGAAPFAPSTRPSERSAPSSQQPPARSVERAVPRSQPPAGSFERSGPSSAPPARSFERSAPLYQQPPVRSPERSAPPSNQRPQAPQPPARSFERSAPLYRPLSRSPERPAPASQPPARSFERSAPRYEPAARSHERSAPAGGSQRGSSPSHERSGSSQGTAVRRSR